MPPLWVFYPSPVRHTLRKLTFSLYTGNTNTRPSDVYLNQPTTNSSFTIRGLRFDSRYLKEAPYYGIRLGTWFRKRSPLGVSFELRHHKAFGHTDGSRPIDGKVQGQTVSGTQRVDKYVTDFRLTDGINTLNLMLNYRFAFAVSPGFDEGRLQTYFGAGPSYYVTYVHSNIVGVRHPEGGYDGEGWGYNLLSGASYGLTNRFSLFGEFAYSSGRRKILDTGDGGTARLDINSFHATFGITYKVF